MSGRASRIGNWGEAFVAEFLWRKGYRVLETNFSCREGEIDLIARKGEVIAFVEVKTRRDVQYGAGREHVDGRKQKRMTIAALRYLTQHPELPLRVRFDVAELLAVDGVDTAEPELRYLENAFGYDPSDRIWTGGTWNDSDTPF